MDQNRGKNNRTVSERLEKKAHTNNTEEKERKEGIVQYIPRWDKLLWVVLYPLRTTCTDQRRDSHISSNSRN